MRRTRLFLIFGIALFGASLGFAASIRQQAALRLFQLEPIRSGSKVSSAYFRTERQDQPPASPKLEGCVTCHGQIEPMHKYGTTETLDKLKDGMDAVGLTCTACHGGNPVPRKTSDD